MRGGDVADSELDVREVVWGDHHARSTASGTASLLLVKEKVVERSETG